MNARNLLFVGCTLASVVLLAAASPVWAGYVETFEGYSDGALAGNAGWTMGQAPGNQVGAGTGVNTSQVVVKPSGFVYDWDDSADWSYTAGDTAIFQTDFIAGSETLKVTFEQGFKSWTGVIVGNEYTHAIWGSPATGNVMGDNVLTSGDWYQARMVVDFSVAGGEGSGYYRNLTTGGAWVADSLFQDQALNLAGPSYDFTSINLLGFAGGTGAVDNILSAWVPEPGTLGLLATGLIGLLCCARRKRR